MDVVWINIDRSVWYSVYFIVKYRTGSNIKQFITVENTNVPTLFTGYIQQHCHLIIYKIVAFLR